jgi:uncharacterized protein
MDKTLKTIEENIGRNYESPPLEQWHPKLSGDIAIRIDREGNWFHEGSRFERQSIVNLFASILRRESDGEYYLVTPGEKWRISVDLLPLMVVDIEAVKDDTFGDCLLATLNTDKQLLVNGDRSIYLEPRAEDVAALALPHGLAALFTRAAWYRLVEMAQPVNGAASVISAGVVFPLERA